ncbi:MAG: hypothetical protein CL676_06425 [Bdellovibrionaceae bacterium]|nr:hypothetical protein [Pseudobdellovibrionaceae bacterium]|tara:strand:- start:20189 stop:20755 length:567 start_codon:yes stop_codon:yes gene_type:complete
MTSDKRPEWLKEWQEFQTQGNSPSENLQSHVRLNEALKRKVTQDIHPTLSRVFFEWLGVFAIAGSLSLLICPQLGVGGLSHNYTLMNVFMYFGPVACFFFCGSFFIFVSLLAGHLFLEKESLQLAFQRKILFLPGLLIFSFGSLKMISLHLNKVQAEFLAQDAPWILGALISGWITMKVLEYQFKPQA